MQGQVSPAREPALHGQEAAALSIAAMGVFDALEVMPPDSKWKPLLLAAAAYVQQGIQAAEVAHEEGTGASCWYCAHSTPDRDAHELDEHPVGAG